MDSLFYCMGAGPDNTSGVDEAADTQLHPQLSGDLPAGLDLLRALVLVHNGKHHMGDIPGGLPGKVQHSLIGRLSLSWNGTEPYILQQ